VLVAHACNPSYSGGRDQEDRGSKPAQTNKKPSPKRADGVAQGVDPEFMPQHHKKKKKKKNSGYNYNDWHPSFLVSLFCESLKPTP
jgi:hypothetical protein